jgi:phospholipid-translocating ATPase
MVFKKLSLEALTITNKNNNFVMKTLKKQCLTAYPLANHSSSKKRSKEVIIRDLVTALALCHNVTPVEENG